MTAVATTAVDTHSGAAARRRREAIEGYLFLLPNILGFLIFFAGPLILSLYYSLTDWDLLTPPKVIWFQNFVDALRIEVQPAAFQAALAGGKGFFDALGKLVAANDPMFWKSLGNTVIYAFGVIAFAIVPAFLLAYLLNSKLRGMTFFRGLYYLPVVASVVGVALVYLWIFYREGGAVNYLLGVVVQGINGLFGSQIPKPVIGWLNDPTSPGLSLFTLIILSSWRLIGYGDLPGRAPGGPDDPGGSNVGGRRESGPGFAQADHPAGHPDDLLHPGDQSHRSIAGLLRAVHHDARWAGQRHHHGGLLSLPEGLHALPDGLRKRPRLDRVWDHPGDHLGAVPAFKTLGG
jgi:ABC-type sugar transport system permease subunit